MKLFILLTLISLAYGSGPKKSCECIDQFNLLTVGVSQKFNELEFNIESNINSIEANITDSIESIIQTNLAYTVNETVNIGNSLNISLDLIKTEITNLSIELLDTVNQSTQLIENLSVEISQSIDGFGEQFAAEIVSQLSSKLTLQFSNFEVRLKSVIGREITKYINNAFDENLDSVYDYLRPPIITLIVLIGVNLLLTFIAIGLIIAGLVWFKFS